LGVEGVRFVERGTSKEGKRSGIQTQWWPWRWKGRQTALTKNASGDKYAKRDRHLFA